MKLSLLEVKKQNSIIRLEIDKKDYQPKVDKLLKEQQKSASLPGFRVGKVPLSIVRNKVGQNILIQQVQEIVSSSIDNYIKTNKLELLGYPLPMNSNDDNQWDNPNKLCFEFEIGIAPKLDFEINDKIKLPFYKVIFNEKELKNYFSEKLLSRYDNQEFVDYVSSEKDIISGKIIELLKTEGSSETESKEYEVFFPIRKIKSKRTRRELLSIKTNDTVPFSKKYLEDIPGLVIDPKKSKNALYNLKVEKISKVIPAQINQDLFDKIYGKEKVKSEKKFFEKIGSDIEKSLEKDVDAIFMRDLFDYLIKKNKPYIPEDFMKKWLKKNSEKDKNRPNITDQEIEKEFDTFKDNITRSLLKNRIISTLKIDVTKEDLVLEAEESLKNQFISYGLAITEETTERIKSMVPNMLANQEQVESIARKVIDKKLLLESKGIISKKEKKISLSDLEKIAKK